MDSEDLLAREEEFRKLNRQLEKKSDSLMKQIENVMQKQDIFSDFTSNINKVRPQIENSTQVNISSKKDNVSSKKDDVPSKKDNISSKKDDVSSKNDVKIYNCCCNNDVVNDNMQFLHAFVNLNVQTKVFPGNFSKEKYTFESVCKFMASKIRLLQEQCDKLQTNINKKMIQCEVHLTKHAELESQRLRLTNQMNNYKMDAVEIKNKFTILQSKLAEKERLHIEQRSETDALTNETKKLRCKNATLEAQAINQMDEIKRLKNIIESMKISEKEFRDTSRAHSASQRDSILQLENTNRCLKHSMEKLKQLVDNLKQQNQLLGTDLLLQALEKDYSKLLLSE